MAQRAKRAQKSRSDQLRTDISEKAFIETILGKIIFINPQNQEDESIWNINWQQRSSSRLEPHERSSQCQFVSSVFQEDDYWWCTAKFEDTNVLYDIAAHIIMDRNEWYRQCILQLSTTNEEVRTYLETYMKHKVAQVHKYKKKNKRMKRHRSLNAISVNKLWKQYGAYLGFLMNGTLNAIGSKKQGSKSVKMPVILYKRHDLLRTFCSKSTLHWTKCGKYLYNVNKYHDVYGWLVSDYVMKVDEYGLWQVIQIQMTYTPRTQMLMIKYDVMLTNKKGEKHFIFRDINANNPNYLQYKAMKTLVSGYIRLRAVYRSIPIVLIQLCLDFRYDENEYL